MKKYFVVQHYPRNIFNIELLLNYGMLFWYDYKLKMFFGETNCLVIHAYVDMTSQYMLN